MINVIKIGGAVCRAYRRMDSSKAGDISHYEPGAGLRKLNCAFLYRFLLNGAGMQITRQADYAIRAVLYLAQLEPGGKVSTAQIARDQHIPLTFLAKIVSQLSSVGVVRATRGAHGGVTLARPPEQVNLLEIVEAIDGPVLLSECTQNPDTCPMNNECVVRAVWCATRADLVKRLAQTNFEQLLKAKAQRPLNAVLVPEPVMA
jgi:Rrf2 family protein